MRYLEYKEHRTHGTIHFPVAFYSITPHHPRYSMVYHWHTEYEIIRVLAGELILTIDGVEYILQKGDSAFITDGVLHGATPKDCHYECIVFDMSALIENKHIKNQEITSIFDHVKRVQLFFPASETETASFLRQAFDAVGTRNPGYQSLFQGALYSFLGTVIAKSLYQEDAAAAGSGSSKRLGQFKAALSAIKDQYQNELTLDDLAACAGMNSKYFCRFFKDMTKKTPIEYLNYYRIECACEQMSATGRTLTEIAFSCGFNDVSYFIKVFKKHKGVTPSQYMKQTVPSLHEDALG